MALPKDLLRVYQYGFADLVMHIDGGERRGSGWPDWHTSRLIPGPPGARSGRPSVIINFLRTMWACPRRDAQSIVGCQTFYRAFSLVNGGCALESDLFAGLCL